MGKKLPPNVSKYFVRQSKQLKSPQNKVKHRRWRGGGLREVCTVCSVIQTHQSLCFCSLEHIPRILLGFVPLKLQQRHGLSPAELSEAGLFKHNKNMIVTSLIRTVLLLLLKFLWIYRELSLGFWCRICKPDFKKFTNAYSWLYFPLGSLLVGAERLCIIKSFSDWISSSASSDNTDLMSCKHEDTSTSM